MGNVGFILSVHIGNILYPKKTELVCSCRSKTDCPLDNKCLTHKIVYHTDVGNDTVNENKIYVGISETPFKERFRNHKYRNSTCQNCQNTYDD